MHKHFDPEEMASAWAGRRGRRGWGGPPNPGWGPGPWAGGRRRRGDIRAAILTALLDGPAHGYELMGRLEERSGGLWRPSPGSVYPTLQMLEEQGLVAGRDEDGKRVYDLTEEGRSAAQESKERDPWPGPDTGSRRDLGDAMRTFALAFRQVAVAGDDAQIQAAVDIVTEARQRLYRLLAGE